MNVRQKPQVVEEFLDDHRQMTRLLARLDEALERHQLHGAQQLAGELNCIAGPHIDFEEHVLYPLVGLSRDPQFVEQLYREHQSVREAIEQLLYLDADCLTDVVIAELRSKLAVGLDHAKSCGTLVSHLAALPRNEQKQALAKLQTTRRTGRLWTELPERITHGHSLRAR